MVLTLPFEGTYLSQIVPSSNKLRLSSLVPGGRKLATGCLLPVTSVLGACVLCSRTQVGTDLRCQLVIYLLETSISILVPAVRDGLKFLPGTLCVGLSKQAPHDIDPHSSIAGYTGYTGYTIPPN